MDGNRDEGKEAKEAPIKAKEIALRYVEFAMIISVTGHRPDKLAFPGASGYDENNPLRRWIREQLRATLVELRPLYAITGMAMGVDQDYAHVCIDLGIPYIAAVPFVGQERVWRPASQATYYKLLKHAHEVVIVSEGGYSAWKMQARNQYMVDHCNELIAVFDGSPGGTANCILYAQQVSKPIRFINPENFRAEAAGTLPPQQ